MKSVRVLSLGLLIAIATSFTGHSAVAEGIAPKDAPWAEEIRAARRAHMGQAVFWLDGSRSSGATCSNGYATVAWRDPGTGAVKRYNIPFTSTFFGIWKPSGPIKGPAGDYFVTGLHCEKMHYNVVVAKFTLKPGDVVNLGRIAFEGKGLFNPSLEKRLEPMFPPAQRLVQGWMPQIMAMMADRPMTMIGPAEQPMRLKGW